MKIAVTIALGLLSWCAAVVADDQAAVKDLVARYDRAYIARDATAIGDLLAADYRVVVEGKVADRAGSLAELVDPSRTEHPDTMSSTVERTHVSGDLAVAVGRIDWRDEGKSGSEHYTLVMRREAGQWRVVEEHVSPVAKPKAD